MSSFAQDVRLAFRLMVRRPVHTLTVIVTLALGIGANTAVFGEASSILLRPFPGRHPEQLARVLRITSEGRHGSISYPNYVDYRERNDVFAGLLAQTLIAVGLERNGEVEQLFAQAVSGNCDGQTGSRLRACPENRGSRLQVAPARRATRVNPLVALRHQ